MSDIKEGNFNGHSEGKLSLIVDIVQTGPSLSRTNRSSMN
jgi:hypothetical protein